jgi:hypothetical protein
MDEGIIRLSMQAPPVLGNFILAQTSSKAASNAGLPPGRQPKLNGAEGHEGACGAEKAAREQLSPLAQRAEPW